MVSPTCQFVYRLSEKLVYLGLYIFDDLIEVFDLLLLRLYFLLVLFDELPVDFVVWVLKLQLLLVHVVARDKVVIVLG